MSPSNNTPTRPSLGELDEWNRTENVRLIRAVAGCSDRYMPKTPPPAHSFPRFFPTITATGAPNPATKGDLGPSQPAPRDSRLGFYTLDALPAGGGASGTGARWLSVLASRPRRARRCGGDFSARDEEGEDEDCSATTRELVLGPQGLEPGKLSLAASPADACARFIIDDSGADRPSRLALAARTLRERARGGSPGAHRPRHFLSPPLRASAPPNTMVSDAKGPTMNEGGAPAPVIRVLIVADHDLFRTGLASLLGAHADIELAAQAGWAHGRAAGVRARGCSR